MKLKMLVGMAGSDFSLSPGDETDHFPEKEAKRIIDAGFAVPVSVKVTETAARKPAPETRAKD